CGVSLEDTQLLASFDAFRIFGQSTPLANDVDWREIKTRSLEAIGQSKDLRLLVHLGASELRLDGPSAYFDALVIADRWLKDFWAQVYPAVDEDAILRRNALNGFADGMAALDALRRAPLVVNRQLGICSVRDCEIAAGRMTPAENEPAGLNQDQIRGIFTAAPPQEIVTLDSGLGRALDAVKGISESMSANGGGSEAVPDFAPLAALLAKMRLAVKPYLPVEASPAADEAGGEGAQPSGGLGAIRTRDDAIRVLDTVAAFFRTSEPSSPVPLFIERAKRLVAKDFLEVLADLAPDALSEAKRVSGIKEE
ncbi:MAG: type VI secretion system ImpA family N-terminal domain-containing protein, partial [Steroidobacteraceae bacterium]